MRIIRITDKNQITIPKEEREEDIRGKWMKIERTDSGWKLTPVKESIVRRVAGKVDIEPDIRKKTREEWKGRLKRVL